MLNYNLAALTRTFRTNYAYAYKRLQTSRHVGPQGKRLPSTSIYNIYTRHLQVKSVQVTT